MWATSGATREQSTMPTRAPVVSVAEQPGLVCFEDAATGEADDVVEESERPVKRAVLVVNPGVDVAGIGGVNEFGGDLIVDRRPGDKFDVSGRGGRQGRRVRPEVELHEEPGVGLKASFEEAAIEEPGVVEEQLRFDATDVGRVEEKLDEAVEKDLGDLAALLGISCERVGVTDYGLVAFVDAEGVAGDFAAIESDEAGKDAGVEVLQKEFGGAAVVPAKALFPYAGLGFEQRAKLARGEVAQVQQLELGGDSHLNWTYAQSRRKSSVEIT